jgi:HTH-type transcriptional regulator, glycine betaine synthesis regulator
MNPVDLVPGSSAGVSAAADRAADMLVFEQAVVAFFVEAADILGVPKSVAAIYGVVFASPEPLCFAEIEGRLDISKGSVSQGLRVLREMGALRIMTGSGDRREFYAPDMELRKLIQRWLAERLQKQLAAGGARLVALNRSIPALERPHQAVLRHRLKYLKAWHDKASKLLPVVKTLLALTKPR